MRSKGYKCYNIECGACVGKTLCGEPADTALGCDSRMICRKTNADHIRAMTDEELATFLECFGICQYCSEYEEASFVEDGIPNCDGDCEQHILNWLKQPYKEET